MDERSNNAAKQNGVDEPAAGVSLKTKISLLGAIALLLVLSYFTYSSILYSPQHLLASFYQPYRPPVVMKDAPNDINRAWGKAVTHYTEKEYQQAAEQFYSLIDNGTYPNYIVRFYAGVSYLGTGTFEGAEYAGEEFNQVLSTRNDFNNPARWYLALAYVRLDENQKAKELLNRISRGLDYGHESAAELIDKLE